MEGIFLASGKVQVATSHAEHDTIAIDIDLWGQSYVRLSIDIKGERLRSAEHPSTFVHASLSHMLPI